MPISAIDGLRVCAVCGQNEDETPFHPADRSRCAEHRNEQVQRWRDKNRERVNEQARARRAKNPGKMREIQARYKYGIEVNYAALFEAQDGRCAACGEPGDKRGLAIDHSHETKQVRGLLCHPCNIALGAAREDVERLCGLIAYLEGAD